MLLASLVACCAVSVAQQVDGGHAANRQGARVTGKVVEASTGVPIQGARITLGDWVLDPGMGSNYPSTETQSDGAFSLPEVPPGQYGLSVEKDGYVDITQKITVTLGDDLHIGFSLIRLASISGRVVDEDGHGISGIRVGAWSLAYRYGHPTRYAVGYAETDETGNYRFNGLRCGVYFVGTELQILKPEVGSPPEVEVRGPVYARSFYPNGKSIDQATGIQVNSEQVITGIEIPLRKTAGYCVTASLGDCASRREEVVLALQQAGTPSESTVGTGSIGSAKRFYFCGVPSGDYTLFAMTPSTPQAASWVASEHVTIDKRDVNAGTLALEQAQELKGEVVVEKGQLLNQQPPSVSLQLEPVDRWPLANEDVFAKSETLGAFTFHRLYSGEYWVDVTGISPGYYVSQISAGRRDAIRGPIRLGEGDLVITVRSDGASLSGIVKPERGSEVPAPVFVVLASHSSLDLAYIHDTRIDQSGRFWFNNVPPGKFDLVAVTGLSPEDAENPSVIGRLSSETKELDLAPRSSLNVELHPVQAP
ncbi:MAG TPA: carboxypeptidase-like regulatory domain-containing protein [Bryobacteraceae bacterium]|nr:carboxypeptidase-like regulatory domain-containing protein [Bryobacteraceae bacterium]